MKKKKESRKIYTLISLLASILVYLGAVGIYFYAHGWRFDPIAQGIIKTGVLTVESQPALADLYIEGKLKGKTPKSSSLPIGNYEISIFKEGFVEWKKSVEIKEEKSTPIYPWLIKKNIKKENTFSLQDKEYLGSWSNESQTYIYFLTKEIIETEQVYRYELYRFDINTAFWDLSPNPKVILTFDSLIEKSIDLLPSPNGLLSILKISDNYSTTSYLLDSTKSNSLDTLPILDISSLSQHSMSWALNNQYLLFESITELISFNIQTKVQYTLITKQEGIQYIWDTDILGNFYLLNENITQDPVYSYSISQQQMDGSNTETILEDMYFQKNSEYIQIYREGELQNRYLPFTTSLQSTRSVGKIEEIKVKQGAKGIYIQTDTSSYWYSIGKNKYYLISPYPSQLVQFSPDLYKLIFKDTQGYGVFTFDKIKGDHTTLIGAKAIKGIDSNTSSVNWISNSLYIWFVKNNSMYISDIDGENTIEILTDIDSLQYYVITISREKVYTFFTKDSGIYIDTYLLK